MSSDKPLQNSASDMHNRFGGNPSKAAKKSAEVRRQKANLRKAAETILATKPRFYGLELRNILIKYGFNPDDASNADVMMLVQLDKAINKGDTSAAIFVRDTSGQSPTAKTEIAIDRPQSGADLRLLSDDDLLKLINDD